MTAVSAVRSRLSRRPALFGRAAALPRPDFAEAVLASAVSLALVVAMVTLLTGLRVQTAVPLDEAWDVAVEFGAFRDGSFGPGDWFGQVRDHRPVIPRALLFVDYMAGGPMLIHLLVTPSALAVTVGCLALGSYTLFRGRLGGAAAAILCAAMAVAFVFSASGVETVALAYRMQFALGVAAMVAAFALVTLDPRTRRGPPGRWSVIPAVALLAFAHLCMAQAAIGWPVLAALLWLRGSPRVSVGLVALTGLAAIGAYYAGYETPPGFAAPFTGPELLPFALGVLGAPFEPFGGELAAIAAGVVYLALFAIGAVRWRGEAFRTPAGLFFAAVAGSVLAMALFTGAFRAGFEGDTFGASRYVALSASGWPALLALAWSARLRGSVTPDRPLLLAGLAAVALMAAVPPFSLGSWQARLGDMTPVIDAFGPRVLDPVILERVYPGGEEETIAAGLDVLSQRELSIFAGTDNSELIGLRLTDHFVVGTGLCIGFFDVVLDANTSTGAGVSGWAWDLGAERPAQRVAIVGPDGAIRGIATTRIPRPDVPLVVPDVKDPNSGWFGYSQPTPGLARAFALFGADVACELTGEHQVVAEDG